jgi:hypothetical protein
MSRNDAKALAAEDAEIETMGRVLRELRSLDDEARTRVLVYVVTRFGLRDVLEAFEREDRR